MRVQSIGFRIKGSLMFRVKSVGVRGQGLRVQGLGLLGFRDYGFEFLVQDLGLGLDLGLKVYNLAYDV